MKDELPRYHSYSGEKAGAPPHQTMRISVTGEPDEAY